MQTIGSVERKDKMKCISISKEERKKKNYTAVDRIKMEQEVNQHERGQVRMLQYIRTI